MEGLGFLTLVLGVFSIAASLDAEGDVALKGQAAQSGSYGTHWEAPEAIDGIKYAPGEAGSCAITSGVLNPWWRLDLLDYYQIHTVNVTNRKDCCPDRLTGAEIRIGNSLENDGNNNPRCGVVSSLVPAGETASFSCGGMIGRYVNIYLPGVVQFLTLCEVEVYGTVLYRKKILMRMRLSSNPDASAVQNTILYKLQSALESRSISDVKLSWARVPHEELTYEPQKPIKFCPDRR